MARSIFYSCLLNFFLFTVNYSTQEQGRSAPVQTCIPHILSGVTTVKAIQNIISDYLDQWDIIKRFPIDEHGAPKMAFSHDSTMLACSNTSTKKIYKWDIQTEISMPVADTLVLDPNYGIRKLDDTFTLGFTSRNHLIATEGHENRIAVWDANNNCFISLCEEAGTRSIDGKTVICAVALSPDCSYLASASYNFTTQKAYLSIWNLTESKLRATIEIESKRPQLRFSRDNMYLASIGSGTTPSIEIWNAKTFLLACKIHEHTAQNIVDLQFSGDGSSIAYGVLNSSDRSDKIKVINLLSKKFIREIVIPKAGPNDYSLQSVAISPDGNYYAASLMKLLSRTSDPVKRIIRIWKSNGSDYCDIPLVCSAKLAFSTDGHYLAALAIDEKKVHLLANRALELRKI